FDVIAAVTVAIKLVGKLDSVVKRQLGTRTDGKMRGMGRIAHQHDMRATVEYAPALADQTAEVEPGRAPEMTRIGHQAGSIERIGEQLFAEFDRSLLV